MRIYLAASFSRQSEMREKRVDLENAGHLVTSRWIDEPTKDDGITHAKGDADDRYHAVGDISDILDSDCMIVFSEPPNGKYGRGGRHVETGFFLSSVMMQRSTGPLIVVGPAENIFHAHPDVLRVNSWEDALYEIGTEEE